MSNKQAKKQRKLHRKQYNKTLDKLANKDYQGVLLKIARQRDSVAILFIILLILNGMAGFLLWK